MWKLYADEVAKSAQENQAGLPDGRWVAARPIPYWGVRWRLRQAWDVLRGKADALYWHGQ